MTSYDQPKGSKPDLKPLRSGLASSGASLAQADEGDIH